MDGFQATQAIKKLGDKNGFQAFIIALTAYTTDNFKSKATEMGMDSFVTKPICAESIKQILIDNG